MYRSLTSSFTEGTFTAVLFMIVKNWKQLKYPTAHIRFRWWNVMRPVKITFVRVFIAEQNAHKMT